MLPELSLFQGSNLAFENQNTSSLSLLLGPVWIEGKETGVEGSGVELAENKLILGQLYCTFPQSKQTISIL